MKVSHKQVYTFLLVVVIIKIFFSFFIELGNDEAYYYTYALKPQLNYFDHPPIVALLIRISTFNLFFVNDVMLRIGPILCCVIASIFVFKTAAILFNERAAWHSVVLYNLSGYSAIIAGWFILPDSAQLPFWCAALFVMIKIVFKEKDKNIGQWILLGCLIGLATLSKIHALYLWIGFGSFILFYRTKWLSNWRVYVGFFTTLIFLLPILIWNINNQFITYRFHSERVTHTSIKFDSLFKEIIGEALYQNPIVWILILVSIIYIFKNNKQETSSKKSFLLLMSLPMIFLFWGFSLFNDIFPHWSGPAYIPLMMIAGFYLSEKTEKLFSLWTKLAAGLVLTVIILVTYFANFSSINLGSKDPNSFGEYSPTLDISGWKDFSKAFNNVVKEDVKKSKMKPNSSILINKWFPACQLELYTSRLTGLPIIAIGELEEVHHFAWLNRIRKPLTIGDDVYCIVPSNVPTNVAESYSEYFETIEKPDTLAQMRNEIAVRYFYIWRLKNCKQVPQDILNKNFNKLMAR